MFFFSIGVCSGYWGGYWVLRSHWTVPVGIRLCWWALGPTSGHLALLVDYWTLLLGYRAPLVGTRSYW